MLSKKQIEDLLKLRSGFLKKKDIERADGIESNITNAFVKNSTSYEVDFILETLTKFGKAPNLIYDDNGLFAVTSSGFQEVVTGKNKLEGPFTVFVEKKQWKKTIREALLYYLKN